MIFGLFSCERHDEIVSTTVFEASLPDGFQLEVFAEGLNLPSSLAFAPDGSNRLFVNELQSGEIKVFVDGKLKKKPFAKIETKVNGSFPYAGENGLIGIAFDNDYATNKFVYFTAAIIENGGIFGKVFRFTDNNNRGEDETIILEGAQANPGHQIQSLTHGPDGKLYVAVGDAGFVNDVEDLNSLLGKILRINPDGSTPDDNPYGDNPVYAIGFRNNYDLVFRGNDLITTENGASDNDELNIVMPGMHYGWPNNTGVTNNPDFVDPLFVWRQTVSPTGLMIYQGDQFPPEYKGKLFQVLFGKTFEAGPSEISKRIVMSDMIGDGQETTFDFEDFLIYEDSGIGNPLDITEGPDGSVYFTDLFQGKICRIIYTGI